MTIRTPDQRLRIFVSSTLGELAPERDAAKEAIAALRLTPVMFELGARPHPPRELYRSYLEQSDVFVGIYAEKYGWIAPGESVSGLEDEYRLSGNRPKLIYLKRTPEREPRLEQLLERIRADDRASYRYFADADELRSVIADDLAVLLTERFAGSPSQPTTTERPALPRPLTRLIGREREVDEIAGLLRQDGPRLVTLVGPGGIGKTRVALAVAERVADEYADGVVFVPLAAIDERRLVVPSIATAVGLREGAGMSVGVALRAALADAQVLLVLDNFEQVADAASDVADLLTGTAHVRVIVTSRSLMNVSGETVVEIGPLALPGPTAMEGAAVQLLIDRARAARPTFEVRVEDRAAVDELVRRLDGLPLAIELAAARLRLLTPQALLERMTHHRLDELRGGARDLPARQQTLRDTIAWSHGLLPHDERALFERLSVFAGRPTLEAIEQVVNADGTLDVLGLLGGLTESSLVRAHTEGGQPRFGMLGTIREFAVERLADSGDSDLYRARHAAYYVALITEAEHGIGTADQLTWLERLTAEVDELRAVLRRAIRAGDAGTASDVGLKLAGFWQMRTSLSEGRGWMEAVRSLPTATAHQRAVAWTVEALQAFWQGDFEPLEVGVDDAISELRKVGDTRALGFALLTKAIVGSATMGPDAAADAAEESAALLDSLGSPFLRGIGLLTRAYVARIGGRIDDAIRLATEAIAVSTATGESYVRSVASTIVAASAMESGNTAMARTSAMTALVAAQKLRNLSATAYALEVWAAAELADGRAERAGLLFALAIQSYRLAAARPWRTEARLHSRVESDVRAALGPRLDVIIEDARNADLDAAITELATTQPA